MDFSSLTDTSRASEGSWLHLNHPTTAEPLYLQGDGSIGTEKTAKPCRVRVRGNRAPEVRSVIRQRERQEELHAARLMRAGPGHETSRLLREDADKREQYQKDLLVATVCDWENIVIHQNEGPARMTPDNVVKALSHPTLMVQILRRSSDEAALFTEASTG